MTHDHSCDYEKCERPARMAVRTARRQNREIDVQASTEAKTGRGWLPYCKEHGAAVVADLLAIVVAPDVTTEETR